MPWQPEVRTVRYADRPNFRFLSGGEVKIMLLHRYRGAKETMSSILIELFVNLKPVLIIDITEIYGIIQMLMTENERTWYYAGFISLHIRERR